MGSRGTIEYIGVGVNSRRRVGVYSRRRVKSEACIVVGVYRRRRI